MVSIVVYITEKCEACKRVVTQVDSISKKNKNFSYKIDNIKDSNKKVVVVPAVFVENELFCYGEFENKSLLKFITKKDHKIN